MMKVMSGPKDLEIRGKSCDEDWRKIIEILTDLQFVKILLFLFEYFFSLGTQKIQFEMVKKKMKILNFFVTVFSHLH
jgi:hypothetical protein